MVACNKLPQLPKHLMRWLQQQPRTLVPHHDTAAAVQLPCLLMTLGSSMVLPPPVTNRTFDNTQLAHANTYLNADGGLRQAATAKSSVM
jgi:hypothetical protein